MTIEWIQVNEERFSPYDPDIREKYLQVGNLLKFGNGKVYLVGDINTRTGECDCCSDLEYETQLTAYAVVYRAEK